MYRYSKVLQPIETLRDAIGSLSRIHTVTGSGLVLDEANGDETYDHSEVGNSFFVEKE